MQNSQISSGMILPDPVLGEEREGKYVFVLWICTKHLPQQFRILKKFQGVQPRTLVLEGSLFLFSKNVLKLSYSNAEFRNFSGVIPWTPI